MISSKSLYNVWLFTNLVLKFDTSLILVLVVSVCKISPYSLFSPVTL